LFGSEITEFVVEIYRHGVKLRSWTEQYRDYTKEQPPEYDHRKVTDGAHAELTWLTEQFTPAKGKFNRYLQISD